MADVIYFVRHAHAAGQQADDPLTVEGVAQALELAALLSECGIRKIVSSPFARALQSIEPLSKQLGIPIRKDDRLVEAALSTPNYADWRERLRSTFEDFNLAFEGGESSSDATKRAMAAVEDTIRTNGGPAIVVTHGRLLTLILRHFDDKFGFDQWINLTTPDVFRVTFSADDSSVGRVWR
jgi:2,3-bisphosphoglycerate-dependent phosphoglycerate mutase